MNTNGKPFLQVVWRTFFGHCLLLIAQALCSLRIGAGIFSLPVGLRHASPIPGLIVLGTIGVLSASSYWMIGYCCISCSVKSFRDLWNMVLGPKSAWIIDVTIFLNGWITLICYIILIGDFTTKSFEGLLGADHILARNRALNETVITVFVLLPLSLAKDLQRLAYTYTSILGLGVFGLRAISCHSWLYLEQPCRDQPRRALMWVEFWHFWSDRPVLSCLCGPLQCTQSLLGAGESNALALDPACWNCLLCGICGLCWICMDWISTFWVVSWGERLEKLWSTAEHSHCVVGDGLFDRVYISASLQLSPRGCNKFDSDGKAANVGPSTSASGDECTKISAAPTWLPRELMAAPIGTVDWPPGA